MRGCCKTVGRFIFDNATPEAVEAGANIPLPTNRVSTRCITSDGSNITFTCPGKYMVVANFTFIGTATGNLETQMYRGGNAVPGAHAFSTFGAADEYVNQTYGDVFEVPESVPLVTINFKPVQAASVRVANITIIRLP